MPSRVIELLQSMDLFTDLTDDELAKVARLLKEQKFAENELIFAQGEAGDALYVILNGRVRIATTDSFGRERVLAFYGPGEFFGDMAVLTGAPRSATATASTDLRLLQLRKDDFDVLVATNVGVMRGMLRVMVERQAAMNTRLTQESGASHGDIHGQVTVVFSPRGGAGQTVLATNLAVALAEITPDRVAIVDLDLLFGHVAMLLDLVPRTALAAISPAAIRSLDRDSLGFYMTKHAESSLRVLAGTLRPEESELVTGEHVRAIIDTLRRQFVHLVIDAGSRFSEPCLAALELADQVIVVSTPDANSTHTVQESQRVLRELLGVAPERIRFVQNQPSPYGKLSRTELALALNTERVMEIPFGGEEVSKASLSGFPLVMSRSSNPTSRAIVGLARELDQSGRELVALSAH
ncbi:MAG TPA: cyclic nucleotide-binding domain-containing protein [Chloroflexota bacterium]|jgi:MinD-like ATPase involved in chromosome partitioning or flagellar assembly|nr:cyclic nucleotide-binding domain-containing protein [Chloroflexota bacterium]